MFDWFFDYWHKIIIPAVVFLATCIVGVWLEKALGGLMERWQAKIKWRGSHAIKTSVQRAILLWFILLGIIIGFEVSEISTDIKAIIARVTGSLFVVSLAWVTVAILGRLLKIYLPRIKASRTTIIITINAIRITAALIALLIILGIWSTPTTPILIIVAVVILAAVLVLRNAAPNFFAGIQLGASQQIKVGDFIKMETGEEGYVIDISWNNTRLKTADDKLVVVPNNRLLQNKVVNYGRPLKKALEPFRFYSRTHLKELTGLRAKNLREFADILKQAPEAVIYYHTHHFIEEHHYLTPEPFNDFAVWVIDALGEEALGERIACVNTFEFATLGALREIVVNIIEEYLAKNPYARETMAGREFYFMKSFTIVLPTNYYAHDLREFVETLRKISIGSLYFHIFESRLTLGNGLNDFSVWMRYSLGEEELSEQIARFDPFSYTLEGLRLALIQLIEKHIK